MKRKAKALIVDDSEIALLMTGHVLKRCGLTEITEAGDGVQALEHFQAALSAGTPFTLVLLDIVMPELDGQEALKRMRGLEAAAGLAREERAVIVMVTSLHSTHDMMEAVIDGDCSDYLVKPFQPEDLIGMLTKYHFIEEKRVAPDFGAVGLYPSP